MISVIQSLYHNEKILKLSYELKNNNKCIK